MSNFLSASSKILLYTSKTLKDEKHPVMLKITFKGKRKYYSTHFKFSKQEYQSLTTKKRLNRNEKHLLTELQSIEISAQTTINRIISDNHTFSFEQFEKRYFTKSVDTNIFRLFQERIDHHRKRQAFKTAEVCTNSMMSFKKFWRSDKLFLEDITSEFLTDYETKNSHLSPNTIGVYERNLKTIVNDAVAKGLINSEINAFYKHKIPKQATAKRALDKESILKILNHKTPLYSEKWLAQHFFIFSYLCQGMNLKDIAYLKWTDIEDGRINFVRKKTASSRSNSKLMSIEIQEPTKVILDHMRQFDQSVEGFIFPIHRDSDINEELKHKRRRDYNGTINNNLRRIGIEVGVKKDFTFYAARHTWATVLKRSGVSVEVIQEGLGHSSLAVTMVYLDSFENSVLDSANRNLL